MKTKLTLFISALIFCGLSFVSCDDDDKGASGGDEEIKVESVEWKSDLKGGYQVALGDNSLNLANRMNIIPETATDQKQSFTSSTTTVATISEYGQVTPVSIGITSITVTVDGQSDSFTLSVVPEVELPKVPVTSINIANPDVVVALDNTVRLTSENDYTVLPANATDKTVTFSSLDESIATVSETGVITGIAEGTTTVTVTSVDNEAVSGTFNVTVEPFYGDYPRSHWTVEIPHDMFVDGNNSITALFDDNTSTWLGIVKPGQTHYNIPSAGYIQLIIDMKEELTVNYFRIRQRDTNNLQYRWRMVEEIYGSNNGEDWNLVTTDVAIPYSVGADIVTPNLPFPEVTYRYMKFWSETPEVSFATSGKAVCFGGFWIGRAKAE